MAQVAVTQYCERVGSGPWAEPFNAFSNLAFLLAALWILWRLRKQGLPWRQAFDLYLLSGLMATIAVGSLLWHTLASPWSEWADVVPILLFISVYLLSYLVRVAGLSLGWVLLWFLLFHLLNTGVQLLVPQDILNGSIFYLPTLLILLVFTLHSQRLSHPHRRNFLFANLVFVLSLILRSVDRELCGVWPLGTHFLWHLLNAWVLYQLTAALLPGPHSQAARH